MFRANSNPNPYLLNIRTSASPQVRILPMAFFYTITIIMHNMVATKFLRNITINVSTYQCTYWFILIFLLAISITGLMNEILLNYLTSSAYNSVIYWLTNRQFFLPHFVWHPN